MNNARTVRRPSRCAVTASVVRGENLFNELVEAGIGGDGSIERATPRTLWVGLRFNSGQ